MKSTTKKKARSKKAAPKKKAKAVALPETAPYAKKCAADRADAAAEVLGAVWLSEKHFELEHIIDATDVTEDADGNPWVTVRIQVPQLDVDCWLDGSHRDHPSNQPDDDAEDHP